MNKKVNVMWKTIDGREMGTIHEADELNVSNDGDLLVLKDNELVAVYKEWTHGYFLFDPMEGSGI